MEFLRLHLPGLHQALRGALDSFSTFVSYLIGDAVPTVQRETQAAEERGEVATGKLGKGVEEEAQESLEGQRDGQSHGVGGPAGPGEAGRHQEGSSSAEQTRGWGAGSSQGSQADRQDTGAKAARGWELNAPLEAMEETETGPGACAGGGSPAQESQETREQEVNREETLRTWELEEEEEEVRAAEPGVARGAEPQVTWHREPEGRAGADGQKVAEDRRETEHVAKEAAAETEGPGAQVPGREEDGVFMGRGGQSTRAQETQGSGADSEDLATLGGEEANLSGVKETEWGPVPGERIPEVTGRVWALEEREGDQEEAGDEKREAEGRLFLPQTQALGTEGQRVGREAAGGQEREEEAGEGFTVEAEAGEEAEGRQDSAIRADGLSLEEEVEAEETHGEEGSCWDTEVVLALDKEPGGEGALQAAPEARPEEGDMGEMSEEGLVSQEALGEKVSEGQKPEMMGGTQTPAEQPKQGWRGQEELGRVPALSREETRRRPEDHLGHLGSADLEVPEAEVWGNQKRRDAESRNTQEGRADAEGGEEEDEGGQAPEAEAQGGLESDLLEVPEYGAEERQVSVAENQELEGSQRTEAGTGQPLGESEARESKASEVEAAAPWEANGTSEGGWRLAEAALSLQDSEDTQPVEDKAALGVRALGAGEGLEWEAGVAWEGEFGRGPDSKERQEVRGGVELVEAAEGEDQGRQEVGLESPAEEEAAGPGGQVEADGASGDKQAEVGGPAEAERCSETSGSPAAKAEGPIARVEAEKLLGEQMLLEEEAEEGQATEWREYEGPGGDHHAKGEARGPLDAKDVVTGSWRTEAQEADPEGLEDVQGREEPATHGVPAEAAPEPSEPTEAAGSGAGDTDGGWSKALLPGSRLDVSVPRSRVLLSRSSSQRRSRPSFRRTPALEQPSDPPSPQPEEGLPAPEQQLPQPEEAPEPSSPKPEGTPVPSRRPLGQGFGLAHPGMMQELQARLGRPKPQ